MKKILLLSNLAWMLIVILIIATAGRSKPVLLASDNTPPPPKCDPGQVAFMSPEAFLKGVARYRKYQLGAINQSLSSQGFMSGNFEDARSCWYSIDELNSFICLTKQKAMENGFNPATTEMGIRFYYAAYPDTERQTVFVPTGGGVGITTLKTQVNVGMHHTLFMVPTVQNSETKLDEPIFITVTPSFVKEQPTKLKKEATLHPHWDVLLKNTQTKLLILGSSNTSNSPSSGNQGMLCPPNCPSKSQFAAADMLFSDKAINQH